MHTNSAILAMRNAYHAGKQEAGRVHAGCVVSVHKSEALSDAKPKRLCWDAARAQLVWALLTLGTQDNQNAEFTLGVMRFGLV